MEQITINKFIETFEWKWGHVIEFVENFLHLWAKQKKNLQNLFLQQDFCSEVILSKESTWLASSSDWLVTTVMAMCAIRFLFIFRYREIAYANTNKAQLTWPTSTSTSATAKWRKKYSSWSNLQYPYGKIIRHEELYSRNWTYDEHAKYSLRILQYEKLLNRFVWKEKKLQDKVWLESKSWEKKRMWPVVWKMRLNRCRMPWSS